MQRLLDIKSHHGAEAFDRVQGAVAQMLDARTAPAHAPARAISATLTAGFAAEVQKIRAEAAVAGRAVPVSDKFGTVSWLLPDGSTSATPARGGRD